MADLISREAAILEIERRYRDYRQRSEKPLGGGCVEINHDLQMAAAAVKGVLDFMHEISAVDAVVLPCNVGDEIYRIVKPSGACKPFIPTLPDKVEPFGICYRNVMGGYSLIPLDEFGKTVFLTREEAEAALERREENE